MELLELIGTVVGTLFVLLFILWATQLVIELVTRVWFELICGQVRIGNEQGADDYVEVANAILGREEKVTYSTYLTPEEMKAVSREVERRREKEWCRVANEILGPGKKIRSSSQLTPKEREIVLTEMYRRESEGSNAPKQDADSPAGQLGSKN